jgi:uncharacterized protein (TIGR02145 family)
MKRVFTLFLLTVLLSHCQEDDENVLKDGSGNIYETVVVGSQTWITSNLKTTRYCDGSEITSSFDYFGVDSLLTKYGRLYPWSVIDSGKNPCPCGYHVPSVAEYNLLVSFLGAEHGAKVKAQNEWQWGNEYATNLAGLSMMPSFWYSTSMTDPNDYINLNLNGRSYGYYWLNESFSDVYAKGFILAYNDKSSTLADTFEKSSYRAIRCLKD